MQQQQQQDGYVFVQALEIKFGQLKDRDIARLILS